MEGGALVSELNRQRAALLGLPYGGEATPDAPLMCFPMAPARTVEPEPYPTPLHTSDQPCGHPAPAPVSSLALLAGTHGWEYKTTHAEGWVPHASWGTPSAEPKEGWAVRLQRGDQQARAVRVDGKWTSLWTWSPRRIMRRSALLDDFKALLKEEW